MMEAALRQADVRIGMAQLIGMADMCGVLPSQQFAPRRKQEPEQRLMMAVLREALHCIEKYRFATSGHDRQIWREARRWFLANDSRWPYSFVCICGVLDLNANAVRQHLAIAP